MTANSLPAILFIGLLVIVAALLGAGLYALFGHPKSHEAKKRKQHIVNGFALGGGILLGALLMGSLVGCSQILFGLAQSTRLSRVGALFIVLGSLALIFSMIGHWAKHFAGWMGYSVYNGLHMVSTGHLLNSPNIPVARWFSLSETILLFLSAVACVRFAKSYRLNGPDKAALMVWVLAFTFAVDVDSARIAYHQQLSLFVMSIGCLGLVAAWLYGRAITRHHHRHLTETSSALHHSGSATN